MMPEIKDCKQTICRFDGIARRHDYFASVILDLPRIAK